MNITSTQKILVVAAVLSLIFSLSPMGVQAGGTDLSIKSNTCVNNDGVVEINTPNGLDSYTLTNTDTGNVVVNDTDGASAGYITFSDLADANYRFEGELDGNFETLNFTVDCDSTSSDPDPNLSLHDKRCEDNDGVVEIDAPNGLDSYKLINTDTGNTVSENSTGVSAGYVTFSDLADANYRFEGTLNNSSETLSFSVDCDESFTAPTCPFGSSDGTVINFQRDLIVSNKGSSDARTQTENTNLSSGTYEVKLYGYDDKRDPQYNDRTQQNQPNESFYISLGDNGQEVVQTPELGDLPDDSNLGEKTKTISNFSIPSTVNEATGVHAAYPASNANSLTALCGAFKKVSTDDDGPDISIKDQRCVNNDGVVEINTPNGLDSYTLTNTDTGNVVVNDTDGASAGYITFSDLADANYRFEGELDGNFETLNFTVDCDSGDNGGGDDGNGGSGGGGDILAPRDDDDDGSVRGDRDENFGVTCTPDETLYLIGEQVLFTADIEGDIDEDDVDFSWSGNDRLTEDDDRSFVQYLTAGIKEIRVEAEYRGDTESDTCYVQIHGGDGVSLDEVPYTGPADTAKTIGFILGMLLLAFGGGYLLIKRREGDGVPVGIPTDHN